MLELNLNKFIDETRYPLAVTLMTWNGNLHSPVTPPHSHDFAELVLLADGHAMHSCGNSCGRLGKGDFLLIYPGMKHAYSEITENMRLYNIIYNFRLPLPMLTLSKSPFLHMLYPGRDLLRAPFQGILGKLSPRDLTTAVFLLENMRRELSRRRPGCQTLVCGHFVALAILLSYHCKKKNTPPKSWNLSRVVAAMTENLGDGSFSIGELAKQAGMSIRKLQLLFQAAYGESPLHFLQRLRVNRAMELLDNTRLSHEEIAERCGFFNYSHMWKCFRKHLGCAPLSVRKSLPENHFPQESAKGPPSLSPVRPVSGRRQE